MQNNNAGVIVGMSLTNEGVYYGFLRWPDGKVTPFSEPNADTTPGDFNGTYPISLSSWGAVTGAYQKVDEVIHGFIREPNGCFIEVDDPNAGTAAFQGTLAANINDNGEVAGFYFDSSNNVHGFIRSSQGEFTTIDRGAVVGWYNVGEVSYGLVRVPNGKFTTIEPSASALYTLVGGINSSGAMAGYFGNNTTSSGFLLKPDGRAVLFNVSGPDGALGTVAFNLNSRREVTGESVDRQQRHSRHLVTLTAPSRFSMPTVLAPAISRAPVPPPSTTQDKLSAGSSTTITSPTASSTAPALVACSASRSRADSHFAPSAIFFVGAQHCLP
jgi:hypothetical protein